MTKKGSPKRIADAFEEAKSKGIDVRQTEAWRDHLWPEDKRVIEEALKSSLPKTRRQIIHPQQPSLF